MSPNELYTRIRSWLWLYDHTPFPQSNDPKVIPLNDLVSHKWASEIFAEITSWELPIELIHTSIEQDFLLAISYAKLTDPAKAIEIHNLLVKVLNYLANNHQAPSNFN